MQTPDWDAVLEDATMTPRGVLTEALADVDEIADVLVITRCRDVSGGYMYAWLSSCDVVLAEALARFAVRDLKTQLEEM